MFKRYHWVHTGHYGPIILDIEWNQKPYYFIWQVNYIPEHNCSPLKLFHINYFMFPAYIVGV